MIEKEEADPYAKRTAPDVLGRAMNNFRFSFRHRMVNGCSEYWLCEK